MSWDPERSMGSTSGGAQGLIWIGCKTNLGRRCSFAFSTRARLAELPDAEVSKIVRRWGLKEVTANTITTANALKTELKAVRARGFAIDDEEKEEGLRCVGAAVRSHSGELAAAMSISGPAFRITKERVPEIGRAVMRAANELSAELGYEGAALEVVRKAAG